MSQSRLKNKAKLKLGMLLMSKLYLPIMTNKSYFIFTKEMVPEVTVY